ncbi:glycosyltransferase family 2 protein [Parapedobacter koreensis]|uniref:Glycosyltransferase involved in cell wall bisynthesis n=1 Tax=Parapedobacter koreensis TaxID=332977 RepID=A0A1H7RIP4_9SPHI|nr:glycosyltransferase family 2 protein [Parapedobacter koreensis]SEL59227.1 Glycosyltransferase involved in cell wall bisynthesis [Parapedobacter koreensis]
MIAPLVTIAIPFYNNKETLLDAIKSVYAQTFNDWELLLLNDGSTDGSLQLVEHIKDPRVRLVDDRENRGLVYRLNQVSELAKGQYIARMDADDLMMPDRIAKQVAFMVRYPETDLVDTAAYTIDTSNKPIGKRGALPIRNTPKDVLKHALLLHASILGRKEWFRNNPYDPAYVRAEDYELWCRTYKFSNFKRIPEYLYIIREGRVNIKNYLSSMRTLRMIFSVYGKGKLTYPALQWEIVKTYLKSYAYIFMGWLNKQDVLTANRNTALDLKEQQHLNEQIMKIQSLNIITQA